MLASLKARLQADIYCAVQLLCLLPIAFHFEHQKLVWVYTEAID